MAKTSKAGISLPWCCAGLIAGAMTLGMLVDGIADGIAAIALLVPSVVVFRRIFSRT